MIYYSVVELIAGTPDDYARLDAAMVQRGFGMTAVPKKGRPHQLPRGMYRCQCGHHASEVLAMARAAARSTGLANEVMVIESAGARWIPNTGEISVDLPGPASA